MRIFFPLFLSVLLLLLLLLGCGRGGRAVVVYTSVDDVFAMPVFEAFEKETGIRVLPVFDAEATKTAGLYHRILAEKERPRADVFWNSEAARTVDLERAQLLDPYASPAARDIPSRFASPAGSWTGFGLRARVIVYNKNLVAPEDRPRSIRDLAEARFRGQAGIAYPLFGTTATHMGALRARLGKEGLEEFVLALIANGVRVLDGNSVVRDRVASGEIRIGLTDTDDAHVALRKGLPVGIVFPDQEAPYPGLGRPLGTFLIPNTVARIRGGPHPEEGKRFLDFLLRPATEETLARGDSAQIPVRPGLERPRLLDVPASLVSMDVSWEEISSGMEESVDFLRRAFVR